MEHDAWFFVGIFAFIFLVWVAVGGPFHPIAYTGPTLSLPGQLGGGTYLSLPRAPFGIGGTNVTLPGSSSGGGALDGSGGTLGPTLPTAFGTPSLYRGQVSMNHYISSAGSANPSAEYIEISLASNASAPVNISGWSLSSGATGNGSLIPKGTETPTSGTVNAAEDIILKPGMRATIFSGQSPIGASFRENKCIGYFAAYQTFSPALPQICPAPSDELRAYYGAQYIRDPSCIDYVDKLSRCQVALSPPVSVSSACGAFMVKYLNYNGCVSAHQNDANFKGDTWRVYLGRTAPLWRSRLEVVRLVDAQGNTVDAFSY
ncbi:hypothetical protein HYV30_02765 [Candidatus Kaiserbacteria bacterium]|nr:hypothetical protein [Candidatus Kaiserbacteria bacterium]